VDGVDSATLDKQWLRSQIGYLGQEPVLFSATIRDNIAAGREDATMQEIEEAARLACVHDCIVQRLPQAYVLG
jgi:ATP-binding cassette, subfamily B, multidrug efflux pump